MENKKRNRRYGVICGVVIAVLSVLSVMGIYQYKRAEKLSLAVENQYLHAFHELADYVRDVEVLLQKSMLVSNPRQLSTLSSNIYMQTAGAKANLALLPVSELNLTDTSKFLSQAGDYAAYLASKVIDSGTVSEEEYKNLASLANYCSTVSAHLTSLQDELYAKRLSIGAAKSIVAHAEEEKKNFATSMEEMEQAFQDYPSLIYDGPFSEHINLTEPKAIQDALRITQDEAIERARSFLGDWRGDKLTLTDEGRGTFPTYNYTSAVDQREISVSITKQGGRILYFLDNRNVTEGRLSMKEATQKAESFLYQHGFSSMERSYYDTENNVATINFAAVQNGVILYPDLVKVKVALDNGEILGMESAGFLMSHIEREDLAPSISAEDARAKISPHLAIENIRLSLIPLDSRREVLCYECKGRYNGKNFLIYINAKTGKEEKILMLLESDSGVLTI